MLTKLKEIETQYLALVEKIEKAGTKEFADYIPEQPDFIEKIIKNIRFGIFSKKMSNPPTLSRTYATLPLVEDSESAADQCQINFSEVFSLEQEMKNYLELEHDLFFDPAILPQLKANYIEVEFEKNDYDYISSNVCDIKERRLTQPLSIATGFFDRWEVVPMAPGIDVLFQETPTGYRFEDEDLLDAYETWLYADREKHSYIQIGGHGMFIQSHFSSTYVAQINNDIGDCGSVFLCYDPAKQQFTSHVDMY